MRCRWCHGSLGGKQSALALIGRAPLAHRDAAECLPLPEVEPVPEHWDWTPQPPFDIDTCGACKGGGAILVGTEWGTGAPIIEECACSREGHPGQTFPWLVMP